MRTYPITPKIVFQGKAFRVIQTAKSSSDFSPVFTYEHSDGKDALGIPRWRLYEQEQSEGLAYELARALQEMTEQRDRWQRKHEAVTGEHEVKS